jgi:hypothetical protein
MYAQFIDVRMEDLVHEANTGRFERILIRELYVNCPHTTSKRRYNTVLIAAQWCLSYKLTFGWAFERNDKLLEAIVYKADIIIRYQAAKRRSQSERDRNQRIPHSFITSVSMRRLGVA